MLFLEATRVSGSGRLILTGQLGDVMKENAQAALTLVKAHAAQLHLPADAFEHIDVHLHVPAATRGALEYVWLDTVDDAIAAALGEPVRRRGENFQLV